jgi:hypothetical protein
VPDVKVAAKLLIINPILNVPEKYFFSDFLAAGFAYFDSCSASS